MARPDQHITALPSDDAPAGVLVREGDYGERVMTVEPGGAEFIPLHERHGRPFQLFWTWTSPNLEFATVFVGVLGVAAFGLSFWQAVLAIVLGSAGGALAQGVLSARGPSHGVPQMVLSRIGFGYRGNILPAGLMSITAGIGWFAVNSVSGTFALNTLLGWPKIICLIIIVAAQIAIAFFGHNLVQIFERYAFPVLAIIFVIATIVILAKSHPGASHHAIPGGFLLTVGAVFGYAAGWNPYASDYTRYFPPKVSKLAVGWWSALGLFLSCAILEIAGAASATAASATASLNNPTATFTGHLSTGLADATLLAIALGAVAANVLNIYSGSMAFVAMGVRLPLAFRRAIVALAFGVIGFVVAITGLHDAGTKYTNFLLLIAYWIAPWLAVVFADQWMRRGQDIEPLLFDKRYHNWGGVVAMVVGVAVSVALFSNQTEYKGPIPTHFPAVGDITFEVGFVLTGAVYLIWHAVARTREAAAAAPART
jgi:nucleobase:cation symporter-1, NCS1 family